MKACPNQPKRLVSPVFFTTNPEDGSTAKGLEFLPEARPLIIIANHQTSKYPKPNYTAYTYIQ